MWRKHLYGNRFNTFVRASQKLFHAGDTSNPRRSIAGSRQPPRGAYLNHGSRLSITPQNRSCWTGDDGSRSFGLFHRNVLVLRLDDITEWSPHRASTTVAPNLASLDIGAVSQSARISSSFGTPEGDGSCYSQHSIAAIAFIIATYEGPA